MIQDFTYHSSKIEGLTLTYHETISYLKYGFLEGKQQSKDDAVDIFSIKNHQQILELYFNEYESKSLSIENIQNAQKIIYEAEFLNKPFDIYNPALGEYKYQSNFVKLKDELGNIYFHEFMKPHLVTQAMIKLVDDTNVKLNNIDVNIIELHPIVVAAQFQYEFLNIHPFEDGNGRTARLFSNLIVMKNYYPPLLIRG